MGDHIFSFEKLEVWRLAKTLIIDVYLLTKTFPEREKYGLTSQINRAAISVASNLAEGSARISKRDQSHFSQLAYSSLMELVCQLNIAQELELLRLEDYKRIRESVVILSNKINALRRSQLNCLK